jgi:hypothetical protein
MSNQVQFTGAPFGVGYAYIAYETSDGSLAVIEYDITLNRYLLYRCEASGDRLIGGRVGEQGFFTYAVDCV